MENIVVALDSFSLSLKIYVHASNKIKPPPVANKPLIKPVINPTKIFLYILKLPFYFSISTN